MPTEAIGGRFAAPGTRAVYLSETDSGASKEVTARKSRLGGDAQITTRKYPRVVYAVTVDLKRVLNLAALGSSASAEEVRKGCLFTDDLSPSMELAQEIAAAGIEALLFPSVVPGGDENLIVYPANCGKGALTLENGQEVIEQAKKIAAKRR